MPPPESTEPRGIPRELDTRLKHLSKLLKHLPSALPTNLPDNESTYHFYLDPEDVEEEGVMYAFNRRLEFAFETHKLRGAKLLFKEQGSCLVELQTFLRKNVKANGRVADDSDDDFNGDISKAIVSCQRKVQKRAPIIDLTAEDDEDLPAVVPGRVASTSIAPTVPATPFTPHNDTDTPVARPMTASAPIPPSKASGTTAAPCAAPQQPKKLSPAEAESQRKRHAAEAKERIKAAAKREEDQKARAAEHKKDLNRERQQRFRDRKKASGDSMAKKTKNVVLGAQKQTVAADVNVAEISRPSGVKWKVRRTGKKNGVIQKRHQRVNWYHPFLQ
ncbi:hypothetical protein B0H14DRAFT_2619160 [Mycena olivaceomarginata]|nr:hypothetical protein B0H14DRAFT_2619160 [Mycena olivaceomarginata]